MIAQSLQQIKTDSLTSNLKLLQHKVDSLEKIVQKNEIGRYYFDQILTAQLTVFTAIIGLSALISWGLIALTMRRHKIQVAKNTQKVVQEVQVKFEDLEKKQKDSTYHIYRTMYLNSLPDPNPSYAFLWAMKTIGAIFEISSEKHEVVKTWVVMADGHLENVPQRSQQIKESMDDLEHIFSKIKSCNNDELLGHCQLLKAKLYHVVYAPESPPENLMEDTAQG